MTATAERTFPRNRLAADERHARQRLVHAFRVHPDAGVATATIGVAPATIRVAPASRRCSSTRWDRHYRILGHTLVVISLIWVIPHAFMLPAALAHPLSNDHVEHFCILNILPDRVELDLLLDIAENPSATIRKNQIDTDGDGQDSEEEQQAWLAAKATEFIASLPVSLNGQPLAWRVVPDALDTRTQQSTPTKIILKNTGVLGMPTYRLMIRYTAPYPAPLSEGRHVLGFENLLYLDHSGLQRILLALPVAKVLFLEPRPAIVDEGADPFLYEQYDPNRLPHERKTTITFEVTAGHVASTQTADAGIKASDKAEHGESSTLPPYLQSLNDPRNDPAQTRSYYRQADRLINLLRGRWSLAAILIVAVFSFVWGAAHALAPGHAKTVVAAYLISRRGSYPQVVFLAVVVTLTHTALVILLGLVIWFYQRSHPEVGPALQLWLGLIAGLLVAGMGLMLLRRAWKQSHLTGHGHHAHGHDHPPPSGWKALFHHSHPPHPEEWTFRHKHTHEHPHTHEHIHDHANPDDEDRLSYRLLLLLGVAGGIVPCPTATIIMLLGIGANLVPGALFAVGVFSLGLAVTLTAVGLLAVTGRRFVMRWLSDAEKDTGQLSARGHRLLHVALPAASGVAVSILGLLISGNYVLMLLGGRPLFNWL